VPLRLENRKHKGEKVCSGEWVGGVLDFLSRLHVDLVLVGVSELRAFF
jgi:hypothetical protein